MRRLPFCFAGSAGVLRERAKKAAAGVNRPRSTARSAAKTTAKGLVVSGEKQVMAEGEELPPAPAPSRVPQFVRRQIALQMPAICHGLVEKVLEGDLAALKMLLQLGGLDGKASKQEGGALGTRQLLFARKALERFRTEQGRG